MNFSQNMELNKKNFLNEIHFMTPYISRNMYPRLNIQIISFRSHPKLLFSE
jgi:hypothetical protein